VPQINTKYQDQALTRSSTSRGSRHRSLMAWQQHNNWQQIFADFALALHFTLLKTTNKLMHSGLLLLLAR